MYERRSFSCRLLTQLPRYWETKLVAKIGIALLVVMMMVMMVVVGCRKTDDIVGHRALR